MASFRNSLRTQSSLPGIDHWYERIDDATWAFFAMRRWDHVPRYTVFMMVEMPREGSLWQVKNEAYSKLDAMLEEFERKLVGYLGRGFAKKWANEAEAGTLIRMGPDGGLISTITFRS